MEEDPRVYLMGLGVPDPKGTFGTTLGLQEQFGDQRVFDIPTAENGMTGIAIGSALVGRRPIMTHQRVDFALLTLEQLFNQAAKWHYMFGGQASVPLVIRMIIGRGWGQGPQHSQSLQALFAHIPGLITVMPTTPYDAKGLLVAAVRNNNPVMMLEHRWLYNISGEVPEQIYEVSLSEPRVARVGQDITIVSTSYMTLEAFMAQELLAEQDISAEVIDVRTLAPLRASAIIDSVKKTGRLLVADLGTRTCGYAAEIIALVCEAIATEMKSPPRRITAPDSPCPTSHALSQHYYPRAVDIANQVLAMLGREIRIANPVGETSISLDIPDPSFKGPF
jgi:pyruvate dehydrogenase E1 component beta subunit